MKLLLLSNSRDAQGRNLAHALEPVSALAGARRQAVFIPFAGVTIDWDAYTERTRQAFAPTGLEISGLHESADPKAVLARAELIIVGGGNTFQLLRECRDRQVLDAIASQVRGGTPYIGWSAGANLACPTICTTNDMPIVDPQGFDALDLIGYQINPHYTNALPAGHQGETRNDRLAELLTRNPAMRVIGLPEGDWLEVENGASILRGPHDAKLFIAGKEPEPIAPGARLPF